MKRTPCSDWLPENDRVDPPVPQKRNSVGVIFWPNNKSVIDQACSVKMAGYWPRSFLHFMDLDFVSVRKNAKKDLANIQSS